MLTPTSSETVGASRIGTNLHDVLLSNELDCALQTAVARRVSLPGLHHGVCGLGDAMGWEMGNGGLAIGRWEVEGGR